MNELSRELVCICVRNGVEIWLEKDRAKNLIDLLSKDRDRRFIEIDEQLVNAADIVGVFTPDKMNDVTRKKNGQWKCQMNQWHERSEKCRCISENLTPHERALRMTR